MEKRHAGKEGAVPSPTTNHLSLEEYKQVEENYRRRNELYEAKEKAFRRERLRLEEKGDNGERIKELQRLEDEAWRMKGRMRVKERGARSNRLDLEEFMKKYGDSVNVKVIH